MTINEIQNKISILVRIEENLNKIKNMTILLNSQTYSSLSLNIGSYSLGKEQINNFCTESLKSFLLNNKEELGKEKEILNKELNIN
jgi:hypothetical protein